jgi:nicotinate phosphoribosyltransferase
VTGPASTALLTDRYELTMLDSAVASGRAEHRAVFELFARRLPRGRRFGVLAGQGRLPALLRAFRFGAAEQEALAGVVRPATCDWLASRFADGARAELSAYAEGAMYAPGSPVVTVTGTFGEGVLLETLLLSVLNHDSAVASAAARMVLAARGRPLLEMGARRTHEQAAVAASRAAYVAGFSSTSNLEAGRTYGIPTVGTVAHAFMLAHPDERTAFAAQIEASGTDTTILVDTFDTERGIRTAVEVAGTGLGGVRLDSGDPFEGAQRARALLDELGATGTRVVVTGDLDEHSIARLQAAPVDRYGVGTSVVTGAGAPTAEFVYKLVAIADEPGPDAPLRPVGKRSPGKETPGGRKWAWLTPDGRELLRRTPDPLPGGTPLSAPLPAAGDVHAARERCLAELAALPEESRLLSPGEPAWVAHLEES